MVNLVKAIEKGISEKYSFFDPSLDEPIFFRAITRREYENAVTSALLMCDDKKIIETIVKWSMQDKKALDNLELTKNQYIIMREYQFNLMLQICYEGLKDFQPDDFSIKTLEDSYIDVRGLSISILENSIASKEQMAEVIKSPDGKLLATIVFTLNTPLTDEAWKLTDLQLDFLVSSYIDKHHPEEKGVKITSEMINQDPQRYRDELVAMFGRRK